MNVWILIAASTLLNAAEQDRAHALYKEIRCPVCTAQSVAESDATLSQDLRDRIDLYVMQGRSDEDIRNELAARYGDSIRLKPRFEARTLVLWSAPWVLVLVGMILVVRRKRS